jgi:hypothetical protein
MIRTLAILLAAIGTPAYGEDRVVLDACEQMLQACYYACKAEAGQTPPAEATAVCNAKCSTRLCGFSWNLSYGQLVDMRIEEMARSGLPGLLLGGDRRN